MKMNTQVFTPEQPGTMHEHRAIARFLHTHLEDYGDELTAIEAAINYALNPAKGGFVIAISDESTGILAAAVINATGMKEYIPEHILVYIAVHHDARGRGLGKAVMNLILEQCPGDIALHVEHQNPAIHLYEKMGFTNPYLEMRLKR